LVYQKKTTVTLQASHRGKEDGSGKGDTRHLLAAMHCGSCTAPPYNCASEDLAVADELHAVSVVETCIARDALRVRLREVYPPPTSRPQHPPHSHDTRTRRPATPPRRQKCVQVRSIQMTTAERSRQEFQRR
jgi:hypothetical protein